MQINLDILFANANENVFLGPKFVDPNFPVLAAHFKSHFSHHWLVVVAFKATTGRHIIIRKLDLFSFHRRTPSKLLAANEH